MRFATIEGRLSLVVADHAVDVASATNHRFPSDVTAALEQWEALMEWASAVDHSTGGVAADPTTFGPPVPHPRQVFALALNYSLHAAEARLDAPEDPLVFTKFPSCLTGPYAAVSLPSDHVDWEVELVVVVGRGGHRIPAEKAWAHVAGLTVGQDLSERRVQVAGPRPQFSMGKSFPGFGPTGPTMVTVDELADPDDLELSCWLGEQRVQHARSSEMIFPVPEVIARLSRVCRLLPGDLIFTGTPAGVGAGMDPPRYLRPDDVLLSRIEGVGEMQTRLIAADDA